MGENYFKNKEENIKNAKEHLNTIKSNKKTLLEIKSGILNSYIFDFTGIIEMKDDLNELVLKNISKFDDNTLVMVTPKDTVSAFKKLIKEGEDRIGLLNFASFQNPGGMFLQGSMAQEECLCHNSVLFPILEHFKKSYYTPNKANLNKGYYLDKGIYSKNIFFTKGLNSNADVLTLAAPNLRYMQRINTRLDETEYMKILWNRIFTLLYQFAINECYCIILGAYGCGVFRNNPCVVASVFKDLLENEFKNVFEEVIFAIPDRNSENFKAFKSTFY